MIEFTKSLKLYFSQHKILIAAVIISMMLHLTLMLEFNFNLLQPDQNSPVITAKLVRTKPPQPIPAHSAQQETPKKPAKNFKPENIETDNQPTPQSEASTPADDSTALAIPGTLSSATLNMKPLGANIDAESNSGIEQDHPATSDLSSEAQKITFSHVETEFEVRRGTNSAAAGITKVTFNIDNGTYTIYSQTQAKGVASLFFGNLIQKSEGSVTDAGLKPDFYSYQYGSDTRKLQSAHFNWSEGVLSLHSNKGDSTIKLPDGTQDFLSFMYQFMFRPPLENMQITMTNGKKLRTYDYSFEGEETISTKLGELKTIHLLKSSSDEDKTEIWLAVDYEYLPVKIVKTEKDGMVIEQLASKLMTKD